MVSFDYFLGIESITWRCFIIYLFGSPSFVFKSAKRFDIPSDF